MKLIRGEGRDPGDEDVRDALRRHYAPPTDESYWSALERRIMTRILSEGAASVEWWSYFRGWTRAGIAAAILAGLIAGATAWQTHESRERVVVEELLAPSSSSPILTEVFGNESGPSSQEASLRYLLSK